MATEDIKLNRLEDYLWEIPRQGGMRVPGRIYASEKLMAGLKVDNSLRQVMNVAHLPGIVGYSLAMPDIHWGYGFPIGGVAAISVDDGVISPGGVGYDINCGVRLVKTGLVFEQIKDKLTRIVETLFSLIPSGVGSEGAIPKLSKQDQKRLLRDGARWAVQKATETTRISRTWKRVEGLRRPMRNSSAIGLWSEVSNRWVPWAREITFLRSGGWKKSICHRPRIRSGYFLIKWSF